MNESKLSQCADGLREIADGVGRLKTRMDAWTPEQIEARNKKASEAYAALSQDEKDIRYKEFSLKEALTRAKNARGPNAAQSAMATAEKLKLEIQELKKKLGK